MHFQQTHSNLDVKSLLLIIFLLPLISKAQVSGVQVGPTVSFYKNCGLVYGGDLIGTVGLSKIVSLGAGLNFLKFKNDNTLYMPVYAAIKLHIPVNNLSLTLDAYPGHGIYKNEQITGAFYFSAGLTLATLKKVGPYISLHYTKYEFHETIVLPSTVIHQTNGEAAFTINAGIWLKTAKRKK